MRIEQLTFTRFIAAIIIVIYHYGQNSFLFKNKYVFFIFQQGYYWVSYFFMLSGFVMIVAYGNREKIDFFSFLKNRLARFYPLYLLAGFILAAIYQFENITIFDVTLYLTMLQTWIPEKAFAINPPGWSLSVELFFYLLFPFFANKLFSRFSLKTNTIWIISFWFISQLFFHLLLYKIIVIPNFELTVFYHYPLLHLNAFFVGNLAGMFYIKKLKNQHKNYLIQIFCLLTLLILALRFPVGLDFQTGLLAVIFIPLIVLIALSNDKLTQFFTRKEFVFLGEISFGIYILQFPVWIVFSDWRVHKYLGLEKEADYTLSFFVRFTILILLSVLSYFFLEKPLRNFIKKGIKI